MESKETFSFATDLHGNLKNIDRFLEESRSRNVNHVIFGGDIAPKKMAVEFRDGKGQKIGLGNKNIYSASAYEDMPDASGIDLYNTGYMLFQSDYSKDEIEHLAKIFSSLTEPDGSAKNLNDISLTFDDIKFLEDHRDLFDNYFSNSKKGRNIFKLFNERLFAGSSQQNLKTPQDLVSIFLNYLKYNFIFKNGIFINKDPSGLEKVLGQKLTPQEALTKISEWSLFSAGPSNMFLRAIISLGPWNEWLEIYNNLNSHAELRQRKFLVDFMNRIKDFRRSFNGSISIILGNDDHAALSADLEKADKDGLITHATNRVVQLSDKVQLLGYSHVPHINVPGIYDYWFKSETAIRGDLQQYAQNLRHNVPFTIANIHCPPKGTCMDQAIEPRFPKRHYWGSSGVRNFLEVDGRNINVALFGHIHESPAISGQRGEQIGDTQCFNPGASEYTGRFLFGDLGNPHAHQVVEVFL